MLVGRTPSCLINFSHLGGFQRLQNNSDTAVCPVGRQDPAPRLHDCLSAVPALSLRSPPSRN